jgi:hypothetical protein
MSDLYETDFYAWANEQAAHLRAGRLQAADIAHIAEEIESMGRGERRELTSRLAVLLAHLLKWQTQPALRGRGWLLAIREQRRQVAEVLADNPSLRPRLPELLAEAHEDALLAAQRETGLSESAFPAACPWTFAQAMEDEPDALAESR